MIVFWSFSRVGSTINILVKIFNRKRTPTFLYVGTGIECFNSLPNYTLSMFYELALSQKHIKAVFFGIEWTVPKEVILGIPLTIWINLNENLYWRSLYIRYSMRKISLIIISNKTEILCGQSGLEGIDPIQYIAL